MKCNLLIWPVDLIVLLDHWKTDWAWNHVLFDDRCRHFQTWRHLDSWGCCCCCCCCWYLSCCWTTKISCWVPDCRNQRLLVWFLTAVAIPLLMMSSNFSPDWSRGRSWSPNRQDLPRQHDCHKSWSHKH